jgi:hypothetical protein
MTGRSTHLLAVPQYAPLPHWNWPGTQASPTSFGSAQTPAVVPEPERTQWLVLQSASCQQGPVARGFWQVPLLVGAP